MIQEIPAGFRVEYGYSEAVCDYTEANYFSTFEEASAFAEMLHGNCLIRENFDYYDDNNYNEEEFFYPDWIRENGSYEENVPQENDKSSLDEELECWLKELELMTNKV